MESEDYVKGYSDATQEIVDSIDRLIDSTDDSDEFAKKIMALTGGLNVILHGGSVEDAKAFASIMMAS